MNFMHNYLMNIMKSVFVGMLFLCLFSSFTNSNKQLIKVKKSLQKTLALESVELRPVGTNVFEIWSGADKRGKVYLRTLTPKMESFDYFVAFDVNGRIIQLQILDYSSQYGTQITHPKWSGRFAGKKPKELVVGTNVDAISGATLSVNALVGDLNKLENNP